MIRSVMIPYTSGLSFIIASFLLTYLYYILISKFVKKKRLFFPAGGPLFPLPVPAGGLAFRAEPDLRLPGHPDVPAPLALDREELDFHAL